jgi:hypothetical protein
VEPTKEGAGVKVKFHCFVVAEIATELSIGDIVEQLRHINQTEHEIAGRVFVPICEQHGTWAAGALLVQKPKRTDVIIRRDDKGNVILDRQALAAGTHQSEVALWLLNPANGVGCVSTHRGAPSMVHLARILREAHSRAMRAKVDQLMEDDQDDDRERAERRAKRRVHGRMKFELRVREQDVQRAVDALKEVTGIEVHAEEVVAHKGLQAIQPLATRGKLTASIDASSISRSDLVSALSTLLSEFTPFTTAKGEAKKTLTIIGKDLNRETRREAIDTVLQHFGQLDYEAYVEGLPASLPGFRACDSFKRLADTVRQHPSVFGSLS